MKLDPPKSPKGVVFPWVFDKNLEVGGVHFLVRPTWNFTSFDHPALGVSCQSMAQQRIFVLGSIIHLSDGGKHDSELFGQHWELR